MKSLPKHQLRLLAEVVVYKLYEAHLDDTMRDRHSLDDVHKMFSVPVSKKLLESSINYMRRERQPSLIIRSGTSGNYTFKISGEGIIFAEQQLLNNDSLMAYFASNGDDSLDEVAGFHAIFHIEDDSSILESWKPLQIDKSTKEYKDFVEALENCIGAIRASNEFSSKFLAERDHVLLSLEEGRAEIEKDDPAIHKSRLYRFFIDPLRWVSAALGKSALTAVANATIQKLLELVRTLV